MQIGTIVAIWVLCAVSLVGFGGPIYAQSPYYEGKTIKLI